MNSPGRDQPAMVFDDLVPSAVEILCDAARVRRPWPHVHALIKSALVKHLHLSVIHEARIASRTTVFPAEAWYFQTSDRFSSSGASRDDLVERLTAGLGGRRALADGALVVVETRTDEFLRQTPRLEIEGIGVLEAAFEWDRIGPHRPDIASRLEIGPGPRTRGRRARRSWLLTILDELRLSTILRRPSPYRLTVAPIEPQPTDRQPEEIEIPGAFEDMQRFAALSGQG
jgi:hypothetical protein